MPIYVPPLDTQAHVTDVLSVWDLIIKKTEALVAVKERQFEWLLRELIINPSNDNNWNGKKLSSLVKIQKGQQLNRTNLTKTGNYPAWNGGVCPSGYTDKYNSSKNTVTISEGGNSCGFVNYCKEQFWCGGHCYALHEVNKQINSEFLYYFLKSHEKKIMCLRVGSGLPNIQKKDIDRFLIMYPERNDQENIIKTLNTAQQEINLLKDLLSKYRLQKRGLMQKLLTGEWQVKMKPQATKETLKEAIA